ncbi:amino acid permease-domain-containing protein [Phascolomyces articulosus]|uniref:Amino acid permease-domain-containing protein n=1 Tax=Phascolomyces articulosus TaxID=60185 RepID=A0AAD5K080_9FUNG|nr:amino acid permease-domain-containing protein [Phascolomyces articulosus]
MDSEKIELEQGINEDGTIRESVSPNPLHCSTTSYLGISRTEEYNIDGGGTNTNGGRNDLLLISKTKHPREQQHEGSSLSHTWCRSLICRKPIEQLLGQAEQTELHRTLTVWQLVFMGIGAIIGTGIFVSSGQAAARNAGPAVTLSFVIAGITAAFAALSYSEMASMIPVSGSAYTYAYVTLGEFVAFIIGWNLILEYMVGSATVAVGWSGYFAKFFSVAFHVEFSPSWTTPPIQWIENSGSISYSPSHYFNVPGFLVILLLTFILVIGVRQSAHVNSTIVIIKLLVILIFIFSLCGFTDLANYNPYVPPNTTGYWREYGIPGIFAGASIVFFSYIGFDAVSTAALESNNPRRDLPIGILGSLVISTVLYIAACTVMTGAAHYTELGVPTPVSAAIDAVQLRTPGKNWQWLNIIVTLGALMGLSSVMLIGLLGQSRIFYSMATDGLFPPWFAKIHPKYKTPYVATLVIGFITAIMAAVLPVDLLGNMTSIGTLFAFLTVHVGVIILRFTQPDVERRFKIPGGKYFSLAYPIMGIIISILLITTSEVTTIWRLFVWVAIGCIVYFAYGIRRSVMRTI